MASVNTWLQIGNIACLLPILILMIRYVLGTDWKVSGEGRALAFLIILSFTNFIINFLGTVTDGQPWDVIRIVVKFAIAAGLFNLVRVMELAKAEAVRKAEMELQDDVSRDNPQEG